MFVRTIVDLKNYTMAPNFELGNTAFIILA